MNQPMLDINPDYPTPPAELCKEWINEGWKHGYEHSFKLASDWGYKQRLYKQIEAEYGTPQVDIEKKDSTVNR